MNGSFRDQIVERLQINLLEENVPKEKLQALASDVMYLLDQMMDSRQFGAAVRQTAGRLVMRAHGLIPPGLLGHEPPSGSQVSPASGSAELSGLDLRATFIRQYAGEYAALWDRLQELCAADVMTPGTLSVHPDSPIGEVARLIRENRIHRILVVEDNRLAGILSTFDLVALLEAQDL